MLPRPEACHQKVSVPVLLIILYSALVCLLNSHSFSSRPMNASTQVSAIRRLIADVSKIVLLRDRCQSIGGEFVGRFGYLESYHGFCHSAGRISAGGGGEESSPEVYLYWTISTGK